MADLSYSQRRLPEGVRFTSLMSDDWHVTLPAWSGDDNTGAESDLSNKPPKKSYSAV